MVLSSVVFALSWRSLSVSFLMPLFRTPFGAMLLFAPLFSLTSALILFTHPLPPSSSGLAASPLPALFSQDVIFDETRSPFLTPPPTPPAPSLLWSDFDPLPSVVPSPPPLPPAPAPPAPPTSTTPSYAVLSGTSPLASSSSAPMPSLPPSASLSSAPAPPPSPRLTRSMTF
ncbi:unnamed protein product [Closterium sp. NIES-53]